MTTTSAVNLGLCEHCGTLISMDRMSADSMNADWKCPKCRGLITHVSFGYDRAEKGAKKVKWVGPDNQWVEKEPTEDFKIGDLNVLSPFKNTRF